MDKLIIKGENPLRGEVSVSGAKNAVLPILAASVMPKSDVKISNVGGYHSPPSTDFNEIRYFDIYEIKYCICLKDRW